MSTYLPIGDFSRATHMTVKTLRHYHQIGLLEPAHVDAHTGYRRYTTEQIPTAQVIRRFRDLWMPLPEIQALLATPDLRTRNDRIAVHLGRLEEELGRTQQAVASLRALLTPPPVPAEVVDIELRRVPETYAAVISEVVDATDLGAWLPGALGELYATLEGQGIAVTGPSGGVYADEVFAEHRGRSTIFVPCAEGSVRAMGRVVGQRIPAVELAVLTHAGGPADSDRSYGVLAAYVARHALAVDGPMRERYVVGARETGDVSLWRMEIGWPVFGTWDTKSQV